MSTWTKFEKKLAMLEETVFPGKNIDQNKTILNHVTMTTFSEKNLAIRLNTTGKL